MVKSIIEKLGWGFNLLWSEQSVLLNRLWIYVACGISGVYSKPFMRPAESAKASPQVLARGHWMMHFVHLRLAGVGFQVCGVSQSVRSKSDSHAFGKTT